MTTGADTLLLKDLMGVVPDSQGLTRLIKVLEGIGFKQRDVDMLRGYGTLICILEAAFELDDAGDMHDRLSEGFYEILGYRNGDQG